MKVFVTGSTGFVGSAVVQDLLKSGHQVLGLVRSDASARALAATGAEVLRGDLQDLESLKKGALASDGIIHTGFVHDFSRFKEVCEIDRLAIETMGAAIAGSQRPFIVTSGTALVSLGTLALESTRPTRATTQNPRIASEEAAMALADSGLKVSIVRLPPSVHGKGDHGFVPALIGIARQKGVSGYIGEGKNVWPAVHRQDAARLFVLALEKGKGGSTFHAIGDKGVPVRAIADLIGRQLSLPIESKPVEHFDWLGHFLALDCPASSEWTEQQLGWKAHQVGLMQDLEQGHYLKIEA